MDPVSVTFKFFTAQTKASPFYTNRADASVEVISTEKLTAKTIESGALKKGKDVSGISLDTRVSNVRIPAGHWLVLSRSQAEQELEIRLRRIQDGPSILTSPTQLVTNEAFSVLDKKTLGLVRNGLTRSMAYRLIVRAAQLDNSSAISVVSGTDSIFPIGGNFVIDTVLDMGGTLELHGLKGTFSGHYDLFVDP